MTEASQPSDGGNGVRAYQREFVEFAFQSGALLFGSFRTKAGRQTPWFFNAGRFCDGASLMRLGEYYAAALTDRQGGFDMLYGAAYKGIPLVAATAIALARASGNPIPWCFNRKESKDHGEGGSLIGGPLAGRVTIIDDVISAGTAIAESCAIIRAHGAELAGAIVSVDRQERGTDTELSAVAETERRHGIKVASIVTADDIMAVLEGMPERHGDLQAMRGYLREWRARLA